MSTLVLKTICDYANLDYNSASDDQEYLARLIGEALAELQWSLEDLKRERADYVVNT